MADIFISYSRKDREKIAKLAAALEAEGYSVWWDQRIEAGSRFSNDIEKEINDASNVIVAWSRASVESMWVADEATIGRDSHKLIPICLDKVNPPIGFRQVQTIAFDGWAGRKSDPCFQKLAAAFSVNRDGSNTKATQLDTKRSGVSLIVLPFRAISTDPEDAILSMALHEDLTTQLARVKDYFVISRNTAAIYGRETVEPTQLGHDLGVTYVLEGSVRRSGGDVRINAQLIDAVSGGHLAALSFDRPATELIGLQNDLIAEIVNHLGSELNLAEVRRIEERANINPTAFESYACARSALAQTGWNKKGLGAAIAHLERAIEEDPEYGPAIAHLSLLKGLGIINKIVDKDIETLKPEIKTLANRAIALDRQSSDVLGFAGCALCDIGEINEGVSCLERAIEIDPSNAQAHSAYGWAKILQGETETGVASMSAAIRISPKQPGLAFWLYGMATGLRKLDQLEAAETTLERAIQFDPTFVESYTLLAEIAQQQSNVAYAEEVRKRAAAMKATYA